MLGAILTKIRGISPAASERLEQDQETFKYCPTCGDEFRAEFERCAVCNEPLVLADASAASKEIVPDQGASRSAKPLSAADTLVNVKQGTLVELKGAGRLLEKYAVASLIAGDGPDRRSGCCASSSFVLQVREGDLARAGAILAEDFIRSTALESHRKDPVPSGPGIVFDERLAEASCPACGSRFVPDERSCPECGLCF